MKKQIVCAFAAAFALVSCGTTKVETQGEQSSKQVAQSLGDRIAECVNANDVSALRSLIDDTAPAEFRSAVNERRAGGRTALHVAVLAEYPETAKILLSAGADRRERDESGRTADDYAKTSRSAEIRRLFGFDGDKPEAKPVPSATETTEREARGRETRGFADYSGEYDVMFGATDSALLAAVKEQNYAETKRLLESGQNVNSLDIKGNNALFYAISNSNNALIGLLLKHNINCNKPNTEGQIPLLYAVDKGSVAIIRSLLSGGANIDAKDYDGLNAVMLAVRKKNALLLKLLHSKGADLGGTNMQGDTLLHIAIKNGDIICTRYLLDNGCSVYTSNDMGTTPLELLKGSKRSDFRELASKYEYDD